LTLLSVWNPYGEDIGYAYLFFYGTVPENSASKLKEALVKTGF
jgi:hypothetical protein